MNKISTYPIFIRETINTGTATTRWLLIRPMINNFYLRQIQYDWFLESAAGGVYIYSIKPATLNTYITISNDNTVNTELIGKLTDGNDAFSQYITGLQYTMSRPDNYQFNGWFSFPKGMYLSVYCDNQSGNTVSFKINLLIEIEEIN